MTLERLYHERGPPTNAKGTRELAAFAFALDQ
jgi:hypothetical protein